MEMLFNMPIDTDPQQNEGGFTAHVGGPVIFTLAC